MISCNDIQTLLRPDVREQIAVHLNDDPTKVALSLRENGPLVATQIKYLQRARTKLPSYYMAQCILPPLSFEQASSEESASLKHYAGHTCLDLTCGLGVDALHFSNHFDQVVTVEQSPELCEIARINFERLQARNIRIQSATAEQFVADLISGQESIGPIDLIYIDPARRDSQGKKVWLLEDCSPDVKRLLPSLLQLSPLVVIKASPLFDIDEAFRLLGEECSVEIISVHGECKEVLMEIHRPQSDHSTTHIATSTHLVPSNADNNLIGGNSSTSSEKLQTSAASYPASGQTGVIRLTASGHPSLCYSRKKGKWLDNPQAKVAQSTTQQNCSSDQQQAQAAHTSSIQQHNNEVVFQEPTNDFTAHYLLIPDVVLYKARLIESYAQRCGCRVGSPTGYLFSDQIPEAFLGRIFPIQWAAPYKPKTLKSRFKQEGITRCNLLKKDFPHDAEAIAKTLGIRQGGNHYAAFTRIETQPYVLILGTETFIHNSDLDQHAQQKS